MSLLSPSFNNYVALVVTRTAPAAPVNGITPAGSTTTTPIDGSVQPVTGRALRDLPEGQRTDDVRVIYTEQECFVRDATHEPDVIAIPDMDLNGRTWRGGNFRVTKVEFFGVISGHFRVTCERTDVP